jgi:serine/threonine protein phosphatase PrpC
MPLASGLGAGISQLLLVFSKKGRDWGNPHFADCPFLFLLGQFLGMRQPKTLHLSYLGNGRQVNEDFPIVNQEQGVHVLCHGLSKEGKGHSLSEFVAKRIQECLIKANQELSEKAVEIQGQVKLEKMQEFMLSAFSEVQSELIKLSAQSPYSASVSCLALWLTDRFAILARTGALRAHLYRTNKVYPLFRDGGEGLPMFGHPSAVVPELLKIDFESGDLIFLTTSGVYSAFEGPDLGRLVQALIRGDGLKALMAQAAYSTKKDATLIQVQFPQDQADSQITSAERVELVSKTPLFKHMDQNQKTHLSGLFQAEEFESDTILAQEGTVGECLYLIAKGTLEISIGGQFIAYKKPGEFFGEISLLQLSKRTATVVARGPVTLLTLQRGDLTEAFLKDVSLEKSFYKGMLEIVLDHYVEQGREIAKMKSV